MCMICKELAIAQMEVSTLLKERQEAGCRKRILKQPERQGYYRRYYQQNRERKLAASHHRHAESRQQEVAA